MYVGITSKTVEERWKQHIRDARRFTNKFYAAIEQFGPTDFDVIGLHEYDDWTQACAAEVELIAALDLLVEGYNSTLGGTLPPIWSPVVREKYSKSKTGLKRPPRSEEHRANLSKSLTGRVFSKETREKMAAAKRGRKQERAHAARAALARIGLRRTPEQRARMCAAQQKRREMEARVNVG